MTWLLAAQAFATLFMCGVIWMCQIAHYPLLADVGDALPRYQARNVRLTTWVVGLPMLVEAGCAAVLLVWRPSGIPFWAAALGAALVVLIWLATIAFSVPMHDRLGRGLAADAHARLVRTNWIRTAAWTARGALVLWMLVAA
ncbi:MAG: hypothetical protein ACR2JV_01685 [Gaiellales bacterium]